MKYLLKTLLIISVLCLPVIASAKAYMGIYTDDMDNDDFNELGMSEKYGILIEGVVGNSPANDAGFKKDDVLMKLNNEKIYTDDQLVKMLNNLEPETKVDALIFRDGKTMKLPITLSEKKKYKKGFLGVYLRDLSKKDYAKYEMDKNYGVMITGVTEDGPAEKAGIKGKDIIIEMEGESVYTHDQLTKMLSPKKPGDNVNLKIFRDGKTLDFTVTLDEHESVFTSFIDPLNFSIPENVFVYKYDNAPKNWIGVTVKTIDKDIKKERNLDYGVIIKKVHEDTPAEKAKLEESDIIKLVNKEKIYDTDDLREILEDIEVGTSVKVVLDRKGKEIKKDIEVAENKNYDKKKDIDVSIENGNVKVIINGEEKNIDDLGLYYDSFDMEDYLDSIEDLEDNLEDIEIDIQHTEHFDDGTM